MNIIKSPNTPVLVLFNDKKSPDAKYSYVQLEILLGVGLENFVS